MKVIIKSGGYGYKAGNLHKLAMRGDVVDIPDDEAKLLIESGNADLAADVRLPQAAGGVPVTASAAAGVNTPVETNAATGQESGEGAHLAPERLQAMTNAELKKLAESMGIDTTKLRTKAQLVAAIANVPLEDAICEPTENGDEDDISDGELPPDLRAEAPIV